RWLFATAMAVGIVLAFLVGLDVILFRLGAMRSIELALPFAHPSSKVHQWPNAARLVADFPIAGVGRGAFEAAFTRYSDQAAWLRHAFIENEYLQAAADWGLPVVAFLLILAGRSLVAAWRRLRDRPGCVPALTGLVALALHDVVDFSTELPGVALPALALAATLFGRRRSDARDAAASSWTRAWHLVGAAAVAAAVVAGAATPTPAPAPRVPAARVVVEGPRLAASLPADSYLPPLVAERLARDGDPSALRWVNSAMYLNPRHPAPHALAAEILFRAGRRAQALLEYR